MDILAHIVTEIILYSREFWLTWVNGNLQAGIGSLGAQRLFEYQMPDLTRVNAISISTDSLSTGDWWIHRSQGRLDVIKFL